MRVLNQFVPIFFQSRLLDRIGNQYPISKYAIAPANARLIVIAFITRLDGNQRHESVTHLLDASVDFVIQFTPLLVPLAVHPSRWHR